MRGLRFVDADELRELARSATVVAAFLATWNRRCQGFAADYRAFAESLAEHAAVVCIDVDEQAALTASFDVCSAPTMVVLRAGLEVRRDVGLELAALAAFLAPAAG